MSMDNVIVCTKSEDASEGSTLHDPGEVPVYPGASIASHPWESSEFMGLIGAMSRVLGTAEGVEGVSVSETSAQVNSENLRVLSEYFEAVVEEFGRPATEGRALEEADKMDLSKSEWDRDDMRLRELRGDLDRLAEERQREDIDQRLNLRRVREVCYFPELWETDAQYREDYNRLWEFVCKGVPVLTPSGFTPQTKPEPLRRLHQRLSRVYDIHVAKLHTNRKVLIVRKETLSELNILCHFSAAHWTAEKGKPMGRFLFDCSSRRNGTPLNDRKVLGEVAEKFGALKYPTITEIVDAVLVMVQKHGADKIRMWKDDISGAFTHFRFRPQDVRLLAHILDQERVVIYLFGMFGWTACPAVFGVITRLLTVACCRALLGLLKIYVDDLMGVATVDTADRDQAHCQKMVRGLLGDAAINAKKSVPPSSTCEMIGWEIDVLAGVIRPNARGVRKLFYCLMTLPWSRESAIEFVAFEKVVSLAQRYSMAVLGMRPYLKPLYDLLYSGGGCRVGRLVPGVTAWTCITLWRVVVVMMVLHRDWFAVPLQVVASNNGDVSLVVETDASPDGVGIQLFDGLSGEMVGFASYVFPFHERESCYQNSREYMALVLVMVLCKELGRTKCKVKWIGDNMSALSWVSADYANSLAATNAFVAVTWFSICLGVRFVSTEHKAGELMGDTDGLSRQFEHSLHQHRDLSRLLDSVEVCHLMQRCNPAVSEEGVGVEGMIGIAECVVELCTKS